MNLLIKAKNETLKRITGRLVTNKYFNKIEKGIDLGKKVLDVSETSGLFNKNRENINKEEIGYARKKKRRIFIRKEYSEYD